MARITEKVGREMVVQYEGMVNVYEILAVMRKWCARYDYDVEEKLHLIKPGDGVRALTIKWACDRKPEDYHHYFIKVKLEMESAKEGVVDGQKILEGVLKITWELELEHDYEGRWQRPTQRFLRAFYDKFFLDEKEVKLTRRLKEDAQSMMTEVKRFLNVR